MYSGKLCDNEVIYLRLKDLYNLILMCLVIDAFGLLEPIIPTNLGTFIFFIGRT